MAVRVRKLIAAAVVCAAMVSAVSCTSSTEPDLGDVTGGYLLVRVNGEVLPAALDRSAARSIDIVAGTLVLHADGRATGTNRVRVSEPGAAPMEVLSEVEGTYTRVGSNVVVTFPSGFSHSLEVRDGGERLRTAGMHCTGDCPLVTGVLHIYEFERAFLIGGEWDTASLAR